MNAAGIYRQEMTWERDFTVMPNAWIRDERISFKAKGLLQYLLSHTVGYGLTIGQIERQTKDGSASIRSALDELVMAGYLITEHTKDARGYNAGLRYELLNPDCENPSLENPSLENPSLENRSAYKKTNTRENKVREDKETRTNARNVFEQQFEQFYNLYPRKVSKAKAKLKLEAALKKTSFDVIMGGLQAYIDNNQFSSVQFVAHPNQWLMDERWDDDYSTTGFTPKKTQRELEKEAMDQWMKEQEALENEVN
jgi:hypothetical protein